MMIGEYYFEWAGTYPWDQSTVQNNTDLHKRPTSGVAEFSATRAIALSASIMLSHVEEQINSSVLVYDDRRVLFVV